MRKYEMMAIYDTDEKPLDETKNFIKDTFSANNINIIDEKDIGNRELAYFINKKKRGHYYLFHLEADETKLTEVNKAFKLYKGIMRYLTLLRNK
jgi:small subunit ribosomal protein S6